MHTRWNFENVGMPGISFFHMRSARVRDKTAWVTRYKWREYFVDLISLMQIHAQFASRFVNFYTFNRPIERLSLCRRMHMQYVPECCYSIPPSPLIPSLMLLICTDIRKNGIALHCKWNPIVCKYDKYRDGENRVRFDERIKHFWIPLRPSNFPDGVCDFIALPIIASGTFESLLRPRARRHRNFDKRSEWLFLQVFKRKPRYRFALQQRMDIDFTALVELWEHSYFPSCEVSDCTLME